MIVTSANPGQANLQLVDGNGGVVDQIELHVEPIATLQVHDPGQPTLPPLAAATIVDGVSETVHFDRFSATGEALIGYNGVDFSVPAPIVRDPDPQESASTYFFGSPLTFHGSDGSATIVATSGSHMTTLGVTFVSPSAITSVIVSPRRFPVVSGGHSITGVDTVGALSDGTPVFGTVCQWGAFTGTVSVFVDPTTVEPVYLEDGPVWRTYFEGTGTATCTVGAATETINVP